MNVSKTKMSDKQKNNISDEMMDVFGNEDGATPRQNQSCKKNKGLKTQQSPPPKVTRVSDHERDAKKKKKKAKKNVSNDEESATQTSSKKKRTSKTSSLSPTTTPGVDHETETSSKKKKKKKKPTQKDGTKKKQKQKKASRDKDGNTPPTTPTKKKSKSQLHGSDNDSPNKKKRMVQFELDGSVREHSLEYIFSATSQQSLVAKKKKLKGKKTFKESKDTSTNTLPTLPNYSSSHMSFSNSMESLKRPNDSYGKLPSNMRGHHDHKDCIENPYDQYINEKGYIEKHYVVDVCDHDEENRIQYKKTTIELADTSIINNRRCLIIAGIFFVICTLTISVICSSRMAEWTGDERRLSFSLPRQHLRGEIAPAPPTTSNDSNLLQFSF